MQEQADQPARRDPATRPHTVWVALPGQLSDDPEVVADQIAAALGGLTMAAQIVAALDGDREADPQ
jgi:hypothetical protein